MANNIGFIGYGMMASSLVGGIIAKKIRTPDQIYCSDVDVDLVEERKASSVESATTATPGDIILQL